MHDFYYVVLMESKDEGRRVSQDFRTKEAAEILAARVNKWLEFDSGVAGVVLGKSAKALIMKRRKPDSIPFISQEAASNDLRDLFMWSMKELRRQ